MKTNQGYSESINGRGFGGLVAERRLIRVGLGLTNRFFCLYGSDWL